MDNTGASPVPPTSGGSRAGTKGPIMDLMKQVFSPAKKQGTLKPAPHGNSHNQDDCSDRGILERRRPGRLPGRSGRGWLGRRC